MKEFICFAHRGASGHEPENTLAAAVKAVDLGAHWIEVDVYALKTELIVIHDDRIERTTNGAGYVMEKTLDYLQSLDAGKGQRIPTLREVFDAVDRRSGINVELKGSEDCGTDRFSGRRIRKKSSVGL
jgi:glycerophosphoryl diester phosphodiesterase